MTINQKLIKEIQESGPILCLSQSIDGLLLLVCTTLSVIVYDVSTLTKVSQLKVNDGSLVEYYCGEFINHRTIIASGKVKDRKRWCEEDDDNAILPTPLFVFDIIDGFICSFEGHAEEVLDLKIVTRATSLDGEMVRLATASQDGTVIIWDLLVGQTVKLLTKEVVKMGIMVFSLDVLTTRYILACVDDTLQVLDLKTKKVVGSWHMNSCYCDNVVVVGKIKTTGNRNDSNTPIDVQNETTSEDLANSKKGDVNNETTSDVKDGDSQDHEIIDEWILLTRGVEVMSELGLENTVKVHRLKVSTNPDYISSNSTKSDRNLEWPMMDENDNEYREKKKRGKKRIIDEHLFDLLPVQTLKHAEYYSNSWGVRLLCDGELVYAPSDDGRVFIFNFNGDLVETLQCGAVEVRNVLKVPIIDFTHLESEHPEQPGNLIITGGDDSRLRFWRS